MQGLSEKVKLHHQQRQEAKKVSIKELDGLSYAIVHNLVEVKQPVKRFLHATKCPECGNKIKRKFITSGYLGIGSAWMPTPDLYAYICSCGYKYPFWSY